MNFGGGGAGTGSAGSSGKPIGVGSIQHPHCTTVTMVDTSRENVLASPNEHWREGWLYVKQTIADYKRSADRSWRQVKNLFID